MSKTTSKTILITGASSGFGRDTAETLARVGHNVFASMRDVNGKHRDQANELRTRESWPPTGGPLSSPENNEVIMTTPVTVVRRFYDALGRGDVPAVLSDKVEWTEAERFPYFGGTWHGPQAVLDNLLKPLAGDWDGCAVKAREFIAEGDRVGFARQIFRHVQRNWPIIFRRLRPRLDGTRRQASQVQHAHRHRQDARGGVQENFARQQSVAATVKDACK